MAGTIPYQGADFMEFHYGFVEPQWLPPPPPSPPPFEYTLTLPTGELVTVPAGFGPKWREPWEPHTSEWNYINLWYHTLLLHYREGLASPFWNWIDTRLGFLGLHDPSFVNTFTISNHWALETSLSTGLRCLESLDLGTRSLHLLDLDRYSGDNGNRPIGYGRNKILRPFLLKMLMEYKSTFAVEQDGLLTIVNLASLSSASLYHLETLLRYDEVNDSNSGYRGRFFKLNMPKVDKKLSQRIFTPFLKLPTEVQAFIIHFATKSHPRRLQLRVETTRGPGENGPVDFHFFTLPPHGIAPILQVNKQFRAQSTLYHDYARLRYRKSNIGGLIYLPSADMIFISKEEAEALTPAAFKASLVASNSLEKVTSISVSVAHPHFSAFIKEFKNFTGLELVFIVLTEMEQAGVRQWGLEDNEEIVDMRLTCKKEIMFEIIHPSNLWVPNVSIPGVQGKSRVLPMHREPEVMEQLVMQMARGQGHTRVAPHVRFVRLVKYDTVRDG